jgi:hypothetical protein
MDGWNQNQDKSLNYIIKLSPQFAQKLATGEEEATFEIPEHVQAFMKSVTIQVGDTPVVQDPPEETLINELKKTKAGIGLTTLESSSLKDESKFATIDTERPATNPLKQVNQSGAAYGLPAAGQSNSSNPASSQAFPAFTATANPAIAGNSASSTPLTSNPALQNRATEPQFPTSQPNSGYLGSSSSNMTFSDPPSVSTGSGYNSPSNTNGLSPVSPYSPSATRPNDSFRAAGPSTFNRSTESPNFGSGNGFQNQATSGGYRPSEYPASPTFPYNTSGTFANSSNRDYERADGYLASRQDIAPERGRDNASINELTYEVSQLKKQLEEARRDANSVSALDSNSRVGNGLRSSDALTLDQLRDYELKIREAKEAGDRLLLFQFCSIVLFVSCGFLVVTLYRLYYAYRNLRVTSRHAVNIGV